MKSKLIYKKPKIKPAVSSLLLDPTRTSTLRRVFSQALRGRLNLLSQSITKVIAEENALGLGVTSQFGFNVFCPTGLGGGVDPTCSPSNKISVPHKSINPRLASLISTELSDLSERYGMASTLISVGTIEGGEAGAITTRGIKRLVTKEQADELKSQGATVFAFSRDNSSFIHVDEGYTISFRTKDSKGKSANFGLTDKILEKREKEINTPGSLLSQQNVKVSGVEQPHRTVVHEFGHVVMHHSGYGSKWQAEPLTEHERKLAGTVSQYAKTNRGELLAELFVLREFGKANPQQEEYINQYIKQPSKPRLTVNTRWAFRTSSEQLNAFMAWFMAEAQGLLYPADENSWWKEYVQAAYQQGAGRTWQQWAKKTPFLSDAFNHPVQIERVKTLASRVLTELKNVTQTMATQMSRTLIDGMAQGKSPREVATELNSTVQGLGKNRANAIAQTETVRAHAEGQLDSLENLGMDQVGVMVEWSTSHLGRTRIVGKGKNKRGGNPSPCHLCKPMEGVVLTIEQARGMIPRHPNCLTGDMKVVSPHPLTVMQAEYTGIIIDVVTADGRCLSVTENHIILTQRGWVFAKELTDADQLIDGTSFDGFSMAPDDKYRPPMIREVFESLIKMGDKFHVMKTLSMPEDFHGDGKSVNSEVSIVSVDSILWSDNEISLEAQVVKRFLNVRDVGSINSFSFESLRRLSTFLQRTSATSDSIVCCLGIESILLGRSLTHGDSVGFSNTPERQVRAFSDDFANSTSAQVKPLVDRFNADRLLVHLNNLINGKITRIKRLSKRHVTSLSVYDVSTLETSYLVNGFITSNCRCSFLPAGLGEDTKGQKLGKRAVSTALSASIRAEIPSKSKRTLAEQKSRTSWAGGRLSLNFNPNHDKLGKFSVASVLASHIYDMMAVVQSDAAHGALVSVRDLRRKVGLNKQDFDKAVYDLVAAHRVMAHRHDFAAGLPPHERAELVDTAIGDPSRAEIPANHGRYWVGIARKK